jgi:hypothetical protein
MLTLANIIGFLTLYWKEVAVYGGIFLILASVLIWGYCGDSRLGNRIDERQPVIVEAQQGANQAINTAINANADAVAAQRIANNIRANKQSNVDLEEAKRNLCIAYPEAEACKK